MRRTCESTAATVELCVASIIWLLTQGCKLTMLLWDNLFQSWQADGAFRKYIMQIFCQIVQELQEHDNKKIVRLQNDKFHSTTQDYYNEQY